MENRPLCYQRFLYMFFYIDLQIFTISDPIIPPRDMPSTSHARPLIRGPPPSTSSSTRGSSIHTSFRDAPHPVPYHEFEAMRMDCRYLLGQIRELERIIQMMDPSRAERELRQKIVDVRMMAMAKLTAVSEGQGDLADWAIWIMGELDKLGGPTFPWS